MDQTRIDLFISTMNDKFTSQHLFVMRDQLAHVDDDKFRLLQILPYKNPIVMLIISIFVGALGIDRFMLGDIGLGILKLITCGGLGVWTIIDWFLIMDKTKEKNYELFLQNAR